VDEPHPQTIARAGSRYFTAGKSYVWLQTLRPGAESWGWQSLNVLQALWPRAGANAARFRLNAGLPIKAEVNDFLNTRLGAAQRATR
jgi:hypothetical protein